MFPFELSPFQKWSIQAIVEGNHALICAHTGSGKTLPAEFAIAHFCGTDSVGAPSEGHQPPARKVIYCSPIKALSNQKYHDFRAHPAFVERGISIGLITGDIKANPAADVLIMTTEILLNKLTGTGAAIAAFDVDIATEVACIIFDEVHYINDAERGHVWEQSILATPAHIQLVMLSATLESPALFADWIECRRNNKKSVYLTVTTERIVPLTHYWFITATSAIFKMLSTDKAAEQRVRDTCDRLHIVKTPAGTFCEPTVDKIRATLRLYETRHYTPTRQHVLNQVCKYMTEAAMFPAICFVYSRRQVEDMARELETVVLEDDSKVRYMVHTECEAILRQALPNWREYTALPEYAFILSLLEKGVAIHHAGLLSVFREMIELIFAKGFVKILFATETFSVGINMPTKTVLFTSLSKYDGHTMRPLLPHEYNQQSGRAGRRGKDTVGHVIHLANLWSSTQYNNTELRHIMQGTPQTLISKFTVSYRYLLQAAYEGAPITSEQNGTMLQYQLDRQTGDLRTSIGALATTADVAHTQYKAAVTNPHIVELMDKWYSYNTQTARTSALGFAVSAKSQQAAVKQAARIEKDIGPPFETLKRLYVAYQEAQQAHTTALENLDATAGYIANQSCAAYALLDKWGYVANATGDSAIPTLTQKGNIARFIKEMHPIAFTEWLLSPTKEGVTHRMQGWCAVQLAEFLSMFAPVTIADEGAACAYENAYAPFASYQGVLDHIRAQERGARIQPSAGHDMPHCCLVDIIRQWGECADEAGCRACLQGAALRGILLGEFVKACLKICNVAAELELVATYLGDIAFLAELKAVPGLMLKYICTNQSLYL
jgi:superfamily II DNA/RNA helicase